MTVRGAGMWNRILSAWKFSLGSGMRLSFKAGAFGTCRKGEVGRDTVPAGTVF